jgi:hypothetical protein
VEADPFGRGVGWSPFDDARRRMRTIMRMKPSGLLALAVVLGTPALASAQLFPNLPLRRERPPCSHENPQYKMIRQEYWGYYPTCWRKFPAGWGCPSPEAPNWERDKKYPPLEVLNRTDRAAPENGPDGEMPAPNDGGAVRPGDTKPKPKDPFPELPNEGASPFEPVPKPGDKPPAPATPGGANPTDAPPTATSFPRTRGLIAGVLSRRR